MSTVYDGADWGIRLDRKGLAGGSSDKLAMREVEFLRRRSHDLCRNNALAITARSTLASHWIGTGIKVKWNSKVVQKEWDALVANPSIDNWGDLYSLEHLWANGYFESGEVFSRMLLMDAPNRKVPLMLQTMEAEQLDIRYSGVDIKYGIKFDKWGKPLEYNFWQSYPGESLRTDALIRVPVDARDVLHIFQRTRPGQWRGIPKLAGVIMPMYEMDELQDATLVRQKLGMAAGWVIYTEDGVAPPLFGTAEGSHQFNQSDDADQPERLQKIKPGGIHYLRSKERLMMPQVPDIGANLTVMLAYQTRLVAAALETTYEQLSGDLTGVNFSSIRAGTMEIKKKVANTQQLIFITQALRPLTERFKELGAIYASGAFAEAKCKFILPRTEWVDPLKDTQSDLLEVRAGFATLAEKLGERGIEDVEEHLKQLMLEQGYNIVLESNPSHNLLETTTDTAPAGKKVPAGKKTTTTKKAGTKNVP